LDECGIPRTKTLEDKVIITFPNTGEDYIGFDIISKWNVEIKNDFGEVLFCKDLNSDFVFSIKREEYDRVFEKS
jgi:hypothetical protein